MKTNARKGRPARGPAPKRRPGRGAPSAGPRPKRRTQRASAARTAAARPSAARVAAQRPKQRTVVVYYSRFGATAVIAREIARELAAELREIRAKKRRSWPVMGFGAVFNLRFAIQPMDLDFSRVGTVVLCSPVWASKPACPVMTFIDRANLQGTRTVLVFSSSGGETERIADAMKGILQGRGSRLVASEGIVTRRTTEEELRLKAREFALELKRKG